MQDSRKREIRIKADYFRANCKISRYGVDAAGRFFPHQRKSGQTDGSTG